MRRSRLFTKALSARTRAGGGGGLRRAVLQSHFRGEFECHCRPICSDSSGRLPSPTATDRQTTEAFRSASNPLVPTPTRLRLQMGMFAHLFSFTFSRLGRPDQQHGAETPEAGHRRLASFHPAVGTGSISSRPLDHKCENAPSARHAAPRHCGQPRPPFPSRPPSPLPRRQDAWIDSILAAPMRRECCRNEVQDPVI